MQFDPSLVSIITPAWKAAAYIRETVASVQQQTYQHWEMLIVDDCSPDDTPTLVAELAQLEPRIRLLRHEKNAGPAAARNTAVCHARGRWIAMLDSDDLWLPHKLEHQLAFHQAKQTKLSYTSYRRISADGLQLGKPIAIPQSLTYQQLLGNTGIATSTVMIDRSAECTIHFKKMYYDDFGCWLDLLRDGSVAYGLDEDLMRYRVLNNSVSRNKWRSVQQVWNTYRQVEQLSLAQSAYHFVRYAGNALRKYRNF